jgi:cell division protein FtsA
VEREAVIAAIDVGTSKVVALIAEISTDGGLSIIGKGAPASSGLKKGVVVNIDQTVASIASALEQAERTSGVRIESAFVAVGGSHIESLNSHGAVAVSGHDKEVSREDEERAIDVARAVSIPSNREILDVITRGYTVDGQEGVKDPLGMSATRLEVDAHIVTGSVSAIQNLSKCVAQAGIRIEQKVPTPLAAAEAVLTDTERDLGVAVADIGAGTTSLALFMDGWPFHTAVLPIGGNNVTNDLMIGLKTSLQVAEDVKINHGCASLRAVAPEELITVSVFGEEQGRTIQRAEVCDIIEARMRELFEQLGAQIADAGRGGILPAGIVLTGGGAQLAGVAELGREVLQMPVRVAGPSGVGGLVDHLLTPAFSTSIGLLRLWEREFRQGEPGRYESAPAGGALGRLRDWVRNLFP